MFAFDTGGLSSVFFTYVYASDVVLLTGYASVEVLLSFNKVVQLVV